MVPNVTSYTLINMFIGLYDVSIILSRVFCFGYFFVRCVDVTLIVILQSA